MKEILYDAGESLAYLATRLAEIVGATAEHIYIVLVRQHLISGIVNICGQLIILILTVFLTKKAVDYIQTLDGHNKLDISLTVLITFGISWLFISAFIGAIVVNLIQVLNPEYYALLQIMEVLQNVR